MSNYSIDRSFSDYVHSQIALDAIYQPLGWKPVSFQSNYGIHIDRSDGIDYVFLKGDQLISVQERFRDFKYKKYSDFTIRYRRDHHKDNTQHESEFYKLKAQYFIYGIVNGSKSNFNSCSMFLKYAVIDLEQFYAKINSGQIRIVNNAKKYSRIVDQDVIESPIIQNRDNSSSFVPVDINQLIELWGTEIVIAQKGFNDKK